VLASWWAAIAAAAAVPAPGPSHPNVAKNCNKWYLVAKSRDNCSKAAAAGGITLANFLLWNPDVSKDCTVNFWPDYYYCIGIDPNAPTTVPKTTSKAPTTRPISSPISSTPIATLNETYSFNFPTTKWNITTLTFGNATGPISIPTGTPFTPTTWPTVDTSFTASPTQGFHEAKLAREKRPNMDTMRSHVSPPLVRYHRTQVDVTPGARSGAAGLVGGQGALGWQRD